MRYDFDDTEHQDHLAPSNIRPPMNFAEGGLASPMTNVINTQTQLNAMARPTGSFSGMSSQLNANPSPAVMAQKANYQGLPSYQPKSYQPDGMPSTPPPAPASQSVQRMDPYSQGAQLSQKQPENFPAQPFQAQPLAPQAPMAQEPPQQDWQPQQAQQSPLQMAKGGSVGHGAERLIAQIRKKFSEQGIDFDKIMAMRLQHMGQKGDTMLAHINPEEAKMLKEHGGAGEKNPDTGLMSFYRAGGDSSYDSSTDSYKSDTSAENYAKDSAAADTNRRDASDNSSAAVDAAHKAISYDPTSGIFYKTINDKTSIGNARFPTDAYLSPADISSLYGNIRASDLAATQAQKDEVARIKNNQALISMGAAKDTRPSEYEMAAAMNQPAVTTAGYERPTGLAAARITGYEPPTGPTTSFTGSTGIVPAGAFQKDEKSAFQSVVDSITAQSIGAPLIALNEAAKALNVPNAPTASPYGTPTYERAPAPTESPYGTPTYTTPQTPLAPTANVYGYTPPRSLPNLTTPSQFRAAENKSMSDLAAAKAQAQRSFGDVENPPADGNVPFPVPRPTDLNAVTTQPASPGSVPPHPVPPGDIPPEPAPLAAPEVPMPPIPYRDLGAGNFLDKILAPFGMDTESWINNKAAEYEKRGLSPSDAATQASYDLRNLQMSQRERVENKGGYDASASTAPLSKPPKTPPTPPAPPAITPAPFRTRLYQNDLANYGLTGGEYSFYDYPSPATTAAKGGYISPLKAVKHNG